MKAFVLLPLIGAIAVWLLTRSGCRHVDEDGRSVLVWTHRGGRLCGWCPQCFRVTRGWPVPGHSSKRQSQV